MTKLNSIKELTFSEVVGIYSFLEEATDTCRCGNLMRPHVTGFCEDCRDAIREAVLEHITPEKWETWKHYNG